ncbi:hypothetical protein M8J75_014465 [Diaphorina citri]|nr:hypothetical protein M8J75_014465 [Diaphorina citri]
MTNKGLRRRDDIDDIMRQDAMMLHAVKPQKGQAKPADTWSDCDPPKNPPKMKEAPKENARNPPSNIKLVN